MCRREGVQFYAFDMEWSERKGIAQPLEIGVVPIDTEIEPFFSLVRPENESSLKLEIFSFLRTKKSVLKNAPRFSDVIRGLEQYRISSRNERRVAIVWHEDTVRFFVAACRGAGVKVPFHKIISLKNLIKEEIQIKGRESGFEACMKEYNIPFDKSRLHDSAYDVICLKKLFKKYRKKNEDIQTGIPLVLNVNSGIIHYENCFHVKGDGKKIRSFVPEDLYLNKGFCKNCCGGTAPWIKPLTDEDREMIKLKNKVMRLREDEQFYETFIVSLCVLFGFEYECHKTFIEIITSCGRWRIFHDGNEITRVDHGNHRGDEQNHGFHIQRKLKGSLYNVLNYISKHDNAIVSGENRKSLKRKKESSKLNKKVVNHAKRNYYIEKDEWEEYYEEESRKR